MNTNNLRGPNRIVALNTRTLFDTSVSLPCKHEVIAQKNDIQLYSWGKAAASIEYPI